MPVLPAHPPDSATAVPDHDALADALRVARRVGGDASLVLHGGGNTSVKTAIGGRAVLWVKGSGSDLARVDASSYTPLDLDAARRLLDSDLPDNAAMYRALEPCKLDPAAPRPSIETLMHAALPATHVVHTHTDAVLALSNNRAADAALAGALGPLAPRAPYRHSGVALARACLAAWRAAGAQAIGLVLDHHGALAVGESADAAHANTLEILRRADAWLAARGAPRWRAPSAVPALTLDEAMAVARAREAACRIAGRRLAGRVRDGGDLGAFVRGEAFRRAARHGPSTPGHAIYTKRHPLTDGDMAAYAASYRRDLGAGAPVDCAPRVIIDARFGMLALGVSARHARIAAEVFEHDAQIMARAEATGGYVGAGRTHLVAAEIEYAGFEARVARDLPRAGEVHLLAAGERDAAIALIADGAAVALLDAPGDEGDADLLCLPPGLPAEEAIGRVVARFGGVDHTSLSPRRLPGLGRILDVDHA